MTRVPQAPAAENSARTGAVVRALAPYLRLTPASTHQHLQRIRRELPVIIRVAIEMGRQQWVDWYLSLADSERLGDEDLRGGLALVLGKGQVDRIEDGARETYLINQDLTSARELDARLAKEQVAIAQTRRFLHSRHPELRPC